MNKNLKPLYVIKESDAKLHISKGNNKIGNGIYAFSTLPGNSEHLMFLNHTVLLTDIAGTCSKYCDGCAKDGACYAWRDAKLHHNVTVRAWAENTLLLRAGKVFDEIHKYIEKKNAKFYKTGESKDIQVRTFRINVSGEVESLEQFEGWNNLAIMHPEVTFGIYTKNYDDLARFLDKHGDSANNFVINCSQWEGVADEFLKKYRSKVNVFTYDDTNKKNDQHPQAEKDRRAKLPHCPAVGFDGHHKKLPDGTPITCDMCRRCYRKTKDETLVWSH